MEKLDLYLFEALKMTSQAQSNFVWRIRAAEDKSSHMLKRVHKEKLNKSFLKQEIPVLVRNKSSSVIPDSNNKLAKPLSVKGT